jgi:hypothetical protein
MGQLHRVGSLEIDQDLGFERRQWTVQRIGWVAMALILLLAFIGLFGNGPLSQAEASSGPLTLQYDRLARERAPSELQVQVAAGSASEGEIVLSLNDGYLHKVDVERVVPEPTAMEAASGRVIYHFAVADPEQFSEITFHIEPEEPGVAQGRLGLVGSDEVEFSQLIYP